MSDPPTAPIRRVVTATPGYAALTGALASFATPRAVFELRGSKARRIVNGLLTNTLDGIEQGRGRYAFALTAKGRPIAEMRVLPAPGFESSGAADTLWLDVPASAADALADHLTRFVPPIFATHARLGIVRVSLAGPTAPTSAADAPAALGLTAGPGFEAGLPELGAATLSDADGPVGLVVRREDAEGPGVDVYVPAARGEATAEALERLATEEGGAPATPEDAEMLRVELGIPAQGLEITPEVLPQETGQQDRAISFSKGCYTGQEVVARIHYRGHVNRHLRGIRLPASAAAGADLSRDGRTMGRITSRVDSPRFGPIGLAYVRREIEPGEELDLADGSGATVIELPFTQR